MKKLSRGSLFGPVGASLIPHVNTAIMLECGAQQVGRDLLQRLVSTRLVWAYKENCTCGCFDVLDVCELR